MVLLAILYFSFESNNKIVSNFNFFCGSLFCAVFEKCSVSENAATKSSAFYCFAGTLPRKLKYPAYRSALNVCIGFIYARSTCAHTFPSTLTWSINAIHQTLHCKQCLSLSHSLAPSCISFKLRSFSLFQFLANENDSKKETSKSHHTVHHHDWSINRVVLLSTRRSCCLVCAQK